MRKTKETKKNKGITLIALVITIIILLILAGVSISMLTGNNGILTQAKLAKENTAQAKEEEKNKLSINNNYINEILENAVPGKEVTETKKDNYVDSNGEKATVPEGFTIDETENIISKGLVIHGPDKTNGDSGSEFVWVPVPDINNMAQCSTAGGKCNLKLENGTLKCKTHNDNETIVGKLYATKIWSSALSDQPNISYDPNSGLREPAVVTGAGFSYDANITFTSNLFTLQTLKNNYKKMVTSVAKYNGFYIGRYETSLSDATPTSAGNSQNAQSKPGVIPTFSSNDSLSMWYGLYKVQNNIYRSKQLCRK